ncbi:type II toxin-antitoxin system RelE family toxin [Dermabacteraceae bacterium P13147]
MTKWTLRPSDRFAEELGKLVKADKSVAIKIKDALEKLAESDNPKARCKPLRNNLQGLHRLRVNDYRVLLEIVDSELKIYAVYLGHRSDVYIRAKRLNL